MEKYLLVILLTFIFPATIWGKTPAFVPQETIALVFSSNVHGESVSFNHAPTGGASCAFLFEVAKHLFTSYIRDYGHYSMSYGALEAMIILVL